MTGNLLKYSKQFAWKNNCKNPKNPPYLFFFTDRKRFKNIFQIIENLPKNTAIIIREYDLNYDQRRIFVEKIKIIAQKKSLKILIGKNLKLALEIKADGVHFSDQDISLMNYLNYKKSARKNFLFTFSAHKISSIIKADQLKFDGIFYSPIFKTKSHPKQSAIGILQLAEISRKIHSPLFALGGINNQNIKLLKNCKISGIGAIGGFFNQ